MKFTEAELREMLNTLTVQTVRLQDAINSNPSRKEEFTRRLNLIESSIDKLEVKLLNL
jgi:hypothetical protein